MDFLRRFPDFMVFTEVVIGSLLSGTSTQYLAHNQKLCLKKKKKKRKNEETSQNTGAFIYAFL